MRAQSSRLLKKPGHAYIIVPERGWVISLTIAPASLCLDLALRKLKGIMEQTESPADFVRVTIPSESIKGIGAKWEDVAQFLTYAQLAWQPEGT